MRELLIMLGIVGLLTGCAGSPSHRFDNLCNTTMLIPGVGLPIALIGCPFMSDYIFGDEEAEEEVKPKKKIGKKTTKKPAKPLIEKVEQPAKKPAEKPKEEEDDDV